MAEGGRRETLSPGPSLRPTPAWWVPELLAVETPCGAAGPVLGVRGGAHSGGGLQLAWIQTEARSHEREVSAEMTDQQLLYTPFSRQVLDPDGFLARGPLSGEAVHARSEDHAGPPR